MMSLNFKSELSFRGVRNDHAARGA
jgi:hypothetical protein